LFTHRVVPAPQTPASSVDESVGPGDSASELSRIELSPPLDVPPLLELPLPLELPPLLELPPVLEPSPGSVLSSPPARSLGASESATSSGPDASGDGESDEESELSSPPPPSPLVFTSSEQAAGPTSHATRMAKRRAWRHRAPRRSREGRITTP
jgi:hypothetical protein